MQRLEVSGAVRPIYGSLGVKRLRYENYYTDQLLLTTSISSKFYFARIVFIVSYVVTEYPTTTPFLTVPVI